MLMLILVILLVMALVGGGVGHSRVGALGWSPAGIVLLILVVLLFSGHRF